MNYSFYLFSKLFDLYKKSDKPYDELFEDILKAYEDWVQWDFHSNKILMKSVSEYDSICTYLKSRQVDKLVKLPKSQCSIIKKALDFYVETSKKLNEVPTDTENYELYDMEQLSAMMNYEVSVSLSTKDYINFESKHGINFPTYIY
jgi:hypothetical protein